MHHDRWPQPISSHFDSSLTPPGCFFQWIMGRCTKKGYLVGKVELLWLVIGLIFVMLICAGLCLSMVFVDVSWLWQDIDGLGFFNVLLQLLATWTHVGRVADRSQPHIDYYFHVCFPLWQSRPPRIDSPSCFGWWFGGLEFFGENKKHSNSPIHCAPNYRAVNKIWWLDGEYRGLYTTPLLSALPKAPHWNDDELA